ncbi:hypothetical protein CCMSSC00406_0000409 [Pleurotus cornucopiae]|uniref:Uncharacterized protein n=1 Tax=Pleurotus cornucopiae TaxID=5321 RepID=A0ACB7IXE7_PLECO|nr:hypothetical protein CCMSSC00406_0000409 [Pleurotus cornucopiae]
MPAIGVAYLGPVGTYTHQAAHQKFGPSAKYVGQDTIKDVFNSLSPTIPFGVVPQENTIFGSVIETYDQLRHSNVGKGLFVVGEVTLGVQHCLLARKGIPLSEIKDVLSHEQVGLIRRVFEVTVRILRLTHGLLHRLLDNVKASYRSISLLPVK